MTCFQARGDVLEAVVSSILPHLTSVKEKEEKENKRVSLAYIKSR